MAALAVASGFGASERARGQSQKVPQFEPAVSITADVTMPYAMAVADIVDADGNPGQDGYPELLVAGAGWDILECSGNVLGAGIRVLRNTGTWSTDPASGYVFHWATVLPSTFATAVAFADVTGENGPDIIVVGHSGYVGVLYVFRSDGNGSFEHDPYLPHYLPNQPLRGFAAVDVDNDGDIDVIVAMNDCPAGGPRNRVFVFENRLIQTGSFSFVRHEYVLDIAGDVAPGHVAVGDFFSLTPGQPFIDFVTPNPYADSITAVRNLGGLQFDPVTIDAPQTCGPDLWLYETIVSGKFGVDNHWDFAAVETGQPYVGVFLGNGLGGFQSFCDTPDLRYQLYSGAGNIRAHGIAAGHLNGGNNLDLVVALRNVDGPMGGEPWWGGVAVLLGRNDGTFQTPSPDHAYLYTDGDIGSAAMVVVADVNNDGFDDIIVSNFYQDTISVLINKFMAVIEP